MNIRKMTNLDYDQVFKLWNNTKGVGMRNKDDSEEGIQKYLNRNPDTCFVAECENNIVGVILCGHDGRRGYIYHTSVDTNFRNRGIGKALVNVAIQALKEQDIYKVALVAFKTNETGNAFWESVGFEKRDDIAYRNLSLDADNI